MLETNVTPRDNTDEERRTSRHVYISRGLVYTQDFEFVIASFSEMI